MIFLFTLLEGPIMIDAAKGFTFIQQHYSSTNKKEGNIGKTKIDTNNNIVKTD